ncbi:MAG: dihydroorotate dehydrogenase electron transfer subunit [Candidatus Aminicenantes bacterium]|nr:MAG: dihydroorotate dehydrogenase electron transfer subunit [Candidatus Aminicenantes bacterium]
MHKEPKAPIIHKKTWGDYCLLGFQAERLAAEAQPGQFIMARPSDSLHPLLRRPISIHSVLDDSIEIYFQQTGIGTTLLGQKEKGDFLDIIGPLGKGFHLESSLQGKSVAIIGGGRGIAPLYFLAHRMRNLGAFPRIYYGGRTINDIPLRQKFEEEDFEILLSTDDGSFGFKGLVTALFQKSLQEFSPFRIFTCGPEAMMAKIAQIAHDKDISSEFSLEAIMGCGFGACWGCVRKLRKENEEEWSKICEEGPVFQGDQIIWEKEEL